MTHARGAAPFVAGVLTANAVPHAFAALTGATHMTPLGGRDSGPRTNALWAAMNGAGAAALTLSGAEPGPADRRAFKVGVLAFSTWALVADYALGFGQDPH